MLGQRTPFSAIAGMTIRLEPAAVFLWASIVHFDGSALASVLDAAADRTDVLLGGPGWSVEGGTHVADLQAAVDAVQQAIVRHPVGA
jgi:hypothetical protein